MLIQAQGIIAYNTNLKYLHMASKITSVYICVCVCIALISKPTSRANIVEKRICCFLSSELLLSACFLNISSFIANWRNAKQFLIGYEIETQFPSTSPLFLSPIFLLVVPTVSGQRQFVLPTTAGNEFRVSHQFVVSTKWVIHVFLSLSPHRRTSMAWAMAVGDQSVCHP